MESRAKKPRAFPQPLENANETGVSHTSHSPHIKERYRLESVLDVSG
jgi:hypothetical protein